VVAGGGVHGKAAGIVHAVTTGAGPIIARSLPSIMMWTRTGEKTTGIINGLDTGGTTNEFPTGGFKVTGKSGMITDTGKNGGTGVSITINPARSIRGRN